MLPKYDVSNSGFTGLKTYAAEKWALWFLSGSPFTVSIINLLLWPVLPLTNLEN
jgi:hypothetical protein